MAEKADYKEIITEYKDQIRILKDEVDEEIRICSRRFR